MSEKPPQPQQPQQTEGPTKPLEQQDQQTRLNIAIESEIQETLGFANLATQERKETELAEEEQKIADLMIFASLKKGRLSLHKSTESAEEKTAREKSVDEHIERCVEYIIGKKLWDYIFASKKGLATVLDNISFALRTSNSFQEVGAPSRYDLFVEGSELIFGRITERLSNTTFYDSQAGKLPAPANRRDRRLLPSKDLATKMFLMEEEVINGSVYIKEQTPTDQTFQALCKKYEVAIDKVYTSLFDSRYKTTPGKKPPSPAIFIYNFLTQAALEKDPSKIQYTWNRIVNNYKLVEKRMEKQISSLGKGKLMNEYKLVKDRVRPLSIGGENFQILVGLSFTLLLSTREIWDQIPNLSELLVQKINLITPYIEEEELSGIALRFARAGGISLEALCLQLFEYEEIVKLSQSIETAENALPEGKLPANSKPETDTLLQISSVVEAIYTEVATKKVDMNNENARQMSQGLAEKVFYKNTVFLPRSGVVISSEKNQFIKQLGLDSIKFFPQLGVHGDRIFRVEFTINNITIPFNLDSSGNLMYSGDDPLLRNIYLAFRNALSIMSLLVLNEITASKDEASASASGETSPNNETQLSDLNYSIGPESTTGIYKVIADTLPNGNGRYPKRAHLRKLPPGQNASDEQLRYAEDFYGINVLIYEQRLREKGLLPQGQHITFVREEGSTKKSDTRDVVVPVAGKLADLIKE